MSRKTILAVLGVLAAVLSVVGATFGLTIKPGPVVLALGAALVYVLDEAKADRLRLVQQKGKWKDPKFWITLGSETVAAIAAAGVVLPISPEIIVSVLTVIVGILFKTSGKAAVSAT